MAYRFTPFTMTLSVFEGHSPIAGVFKCVFPHKCAAVDKNSAYSPLYGPSVIAEVLLQ